MKFFRTARHGGLVFAAVCLFAMSTSAQENVEATQTTETTDTVSKSVAWQTTFETDLLSDFVDNPDSAIAVIASSGTESSSEAAQALIQALRRGRAAVVIDDQWLGNTAGLSDHAIVKKSAAQPVDLIVIVRVFGNLTPEPNATAIVSAYNKQGDSLWTIVAKKGQALTAEQSTMLAARQKPDDLEEPEHEIPPLTRAQKMYEGRKLSLQRSFQGFTVSEGGGDYALHGVSLSGSDFYDTVGQPELAAKYRRNETRSAWGTGFTAMGTLGTLGFGIWSFTSWILSELNPDKDYNLRLPLGLTAGSLGVAILGGIIQPARMHPVSIHQARQFVDDYNEDLREELGLSDDETVLQDPQRTKPDASDYGLRFVFHPSGGQLVVHASF